MGKLAHPTNLYATLGSKLGHEGGAKLGVSILHQEMRKIKKKPNKSKGICVAW